LQFRTKRGLEESVPDFVVAEIRLFGRAANAHFGIFGPGGVTHGADYQRS
jgi:hypothetical protein